MENISNKLCFSGVMDGEKMWSIKFFVMDSRELGELSALKDKVNSQKVSTFLPLSLK